MSVAQRIIACRDFVIEVFTEDDFAELVFVTFEQDYHAIKVGAAFKARVFQVIVGLYREGGPVFLDRLAAAALKERKNRKDLQQLIDRMNDGMVGAVPPVHVAVNVTPVPSPVVTLILLLKEELPAQIEGLVTDLRKEIRGADENIRRGICGKMHLSEEDAERLAAVVAWERAPETNYLRWVSERVIVEPPITAFVAAQALVVAAVQLEAKDLARVKAVARLAAARLDGMIQDPDDPTIARLGLAVRKRELLNAIAVVDTRSQDRKGLMTSEQVSSFLTVVAKLDVDTLARMCEARLKTALRFLADPNDPIEIIVVNLLLTARDRGWEPDLIRAASAEQPADPVLADLAARFSKA
jgi:hypothetical protein